LKVAHKYLNLSTNIEYRWEINVNATKKKSNIGRLTRYALQQSARISAETIKGQDSRRDTDQIRAFTSRSAETFEDRDSRREDERETKVDQERETI